MEMMRHHHHHHHHQMLPRVTLQSTTGSQGQQQQQQQQQHVQDEGMLGSRAASFNLDQRGGDFLLLQQQQQQQQQPTSRAEGGGGLATNPSQPLIVMESRSSGNGQQQQQQPPVPPAPAHAHALPAQPQRPSITAVDLPPTLDEDTENRFFEDENQNDNHNNNNNNNNQGYQNPQQQESHRNASAALDDDLAGEEQQHHQEQQQQQQQPPQQTSTPFTRAQGRNGFTATSAPAPSAAATPTPTATATPSATPIPITPRVTPIHAREQPQQPKRPTPQQYPAAAAAASAAPANNTAATVAATPRAASSAAKADSMAAQQHQKDEQSKVSPARREQQQPPTKKIKKMPRLLSDSAAALFHSPPSVVPHQQQRASSPARRNQRQDHHQQQSQHQQYHQLPVRRNAAEIRDAVLRLLASNQPNGKPSMVTNVREPKQQANDVPMTGQQQQHHHQHVIELLYCVQTSGELQSLLNNGFDGLVSTGASGSSTATSQLSASMFLSVPHSRPAGRNNRSANNNSNNNNTTTTTDTSRAASSSAISTKHQPQQQSRGERVTTFALCRVETHRIRFCLTHSDATEHFANGTGDTCFIVESGCVAVSSPERVRVEAVVDVVWTPYAALAPPTCDSHPGVELVLFDVASQQLACPICVATSKGWSRQQQQQQQDQPRKYVVLSEILGSSNNKNNHGSGAGRVGNHQYHVNNVASKLEEAVDALCRSKLPQSIADHSLIANAAARRRVAIATQFDLLRAALDAKQAELIDELSEQERAATKRVARDILTFQDAARHAANALTLIRSSIDSSNSGSGGANDHSKNSSHAAFSSSSSSFSAQHGEMGGSSSSSSSSALCVEQLMCIVNSLQNAHTVLSQEGRAHASSSQSSLSSATAAAAGITGNGFFRGNQTAFDNLLLPSSSSFGNTNDKNSSSNNSHQSPDGGRRRSSINNKTPSALAITPSRVAAGESALAFEMAFQLDIDSTLRAINDVTFRGRRSQATAHPQHPQQPQQQQQQQQITSSRTSQSPQRLQRAGSAGSIGSAASGIIMDGQFSSAPAAASLTVATAIRNRKQKLLFERSSSPSNKFLFNVPQQQHEQQQQYHPRHHRSASASGSSSTAGCGGDSRNNNNNRTMMVSFGGDRGAEVMMMSGSGRKQQRRQSQTRALSSSPSSAMKLATRLARATSPSRGPALGSLPGGGGLLQLVMPMNISGDEQQQYHQLSSNSRNHHGLASITTGNVASAKQQEQHLNLFDVPLHTLFGSGGSRTVVTFELRVDDPGECLSVGASVGVPLSSIQLGQQQADIKHLAVLLVPPTRRLKVRLTLGAHGAVKLAVFNASGRQLDDGGVPHWPHTRVAYPLVTFGNRAGSVTMVQAPQIVSSHIL